MFTTYHHLMGNIKSGNIQLFHLTDFTFQAPLTSDQTNKLTWRLYFLKDLASDWWDRVCLEIERSYWPTDLLLHSHWSIITWFPMRGREREVEISQVYFWIIRSKVYFRLLEVKSNYSRIKIYTMNFLHLFRSLIWRSIGTRLVEEIDY